MNSCRTAPKAWDLLAKEFGVALTIHIQKLQEELHDLALSPGMSIQSYILHAKTLSHSLARAGEAVSTQTLRFRILGGLGHTYKEFITTQNSKGDTTIEDLKDLLLQEETLQKKNLPKLAPPLVPLLPLKNPTHLNLTLPLHLMLEFQIQKC